VRGAGDSALKFVFAALTFYFLSAVQAKEIHEPLQSVRQLGMGGVYVFDENDSTSFNQNPAYTCFTEGLNWNIFDISLGAGDLSLAETFANGLPDITGINGLNEFYGKRVSAGVDARSTLTLPCFGMSGYYQVLANFRMHNPAYPTLDTFYLQEYAFKIGGGFKIGDVFSFGMDVKRVDRKGGPYSFGVNTLVSLGADGLTTLLEQIENQGVGFGLDIGMVTRFSKLPLNPTLSLAWKDVGSTAFERTKGATYPERQKDNLVLGATVGGGLPGLGLAAGIEYRHITDNDEQIGKKIHLGGEISLAFLDVRGGLYQGYSTYGVGIDLWLLEMDATLYSVETGAYPGQSEEKRAQVSLLLNLEFDPNFNLVDAGGKRRKLKQRR
jgi:hypothetical protein